ncbi:MAG: hypothetical protein P8100_09995 [bacterium]
MSENDSWQNARYTGEKVWQAIQYQLSEGRGFLSAMFASFKLFLRKQILFLILFGIIGGAMGAGIWFLKPKVYEKKIYADMLEKLNKLIESKSYASLSDLLGIPEEKAESIKGIKGLNIKREELTEDLSTEKVPFYIVVKVTDVSLLNELEDALIKYLDGTEFIQTRLAYMKEKSERELIFLENRLHTVDSLSNLLILQEGNLLNEKRVTRMELLQETLALYERIQSVKGSLAFNLNIEVLDGFVANEEPSGKRLPYWVVYGFVLGVLFWLVVLLFR